MSNKYHRNLHKIPFRLIPNLAYHLILRTSPVDNPFFLDAHVHDVISSGVRQNRYSSMTALIGATSRHGVSRELIYASSVS